MIRHTSLYILVFCFQVFPAAAQRAYSPSPDIDIITYVFTIDISQQTNAVICQADVTFRAKHDLEMISLDLVTTEGNGKGMRTSAVTENGEPLDFIHERDSLKVFVPGTPGGLKRTLHIEYGGIPADGLIIRKNKYGDLTYFGDNWPNRAHNYLPCVDHPGDKATVTFNIIAPPDYQVVANGRLIEEVNIDKSHTRTVWMTDRPLATKVIVFGAARFAVDYPARVGNIPVSNWVYPRDEQKGQTDFSSSPGILQYFIDSIGEYPYEKLANVQSNTRYGGMENASNIFYPENFLTGRATGIDVLAHETSHQWFGNSVTESDWSQIWLSEGIAEYLDHIYIGHVKGEDALKYLMRSDRRLVTTFARVWKKPVVDSTTIDLNRLLNENTYQKGSWVLHMLRMEIGDAYFWETLREYYRKYRDSNASTEDFKAVVEHVSGRNLEWFFDQWLYSVGHPVLDIHTEMNNSTCSVVVKQVQKSSKPFRFDLDLLFELPGGEFSQKRFHIEESAHVFVLDEKVCPIDVIPDPDTRLLFEMK